jgi:hypothetical protein
MRLSATFPSVAERASAVWIALFSEAMPKNKDDKGVLKLYGEIWWVVSGPEPSSDDYTIYSRAYGGGRALGGSTEILEYSILLVTERDVYCGWCWCCIGNHRC